MIHHHEIGGISITTISKKVLSFFYINW